MPAMIARTSLKSLNTKQQEVPFFADLLHLQQPGLYFPPYRQNPGRRSQRFPRRFHPHCPNSLDNIELDENLKVDNQVTFSQFQPAVSVYESAFGPYLTVTTMW